MEDERIVDLFWKRDETALAETESKYSRYCFAIANGILRNDEDAHECVNDTLLAAWNAIPPNRPEILSTFLGKITRNLSLMKLRKRTADKRGGGNAETALDEYEELIPSDMRIDENLDAEAIACILNDFLASVSQDERRVFLRRYWYFDSISDIASRLNFSQSKVKMMLKRTRDRLMARLQKEGVYV